MKLSDFLTDIGKPIAFYPGLRQITKSITATLFLCQFIYWTGKEANKDGWIYKSAVEIEGETGMTYEEQKTARKYLLREGLIEEKYRRDIHKMYFRVLFDNVDLKWEGASSESPIGQNHAPEQGNATFGKKAMARSLTTENTTETTSENTITDDKSSETIYEDCDDYGEPVKDKKKPRPKQDTKKLYPIAAALSEVTGMSLESNKEKVFREAKLIVRDPRVTAEEIRQQFSPGADWYRFDWRGKKGQRPILTQVRETIFTFPVDEDKAKEFNAEEFLKNGY